MKISWQEGHLPSLISTLTSWIVNGEKDVISLSLGVLVNLCYKNLPAMYTLMRSVDSKEFLRTILKLQNDGTDTRVQVLVFFFFFRVSVTYRVGQTVIIYIYTIYCIPTFGPPCICVISCFIFLQFVLYVLQLSLQFF